MGLGPHHQKYEMQMAIGVVGSIREARALLVVCISSGSSLENRALMCISSALMAFMARRNGGEVVAGEAGRRRNGRRGRRVLLMAKARALIIYLSMSCRAPQACASIRVYHKPSLIIQCQSAKSTISSYHYQFIGNNTVTVMKLGSGGK